MVGGQAMANATDGGGGGRRTGMTSENTTAPVQDVVFMGQKMEMSGGIDEVTDDGDRGWGTNI